MKPVLQLKLNGSALQISQRHQNAGYMPQLRGNLQDILLIQTRFGKSEKIRNNDRGSIQLLHRHIEIFLLFFAGAFS
ncbi:hypothetical protein D3C85_1701710 [compost metagenome]